MLFTFGSQKSEITQGEFVSILDFCLSQGLGLDTLEESIAKIAKSIDFEIRNENDSKKLYLELLILHMWVITYTCEKLFEDEDKRNACLDLFHHHVYKANYKDLPDEGFNQWMKSIRIRYMEYYAAIENLKEAGPIWWLSKAVNRNIFGELKKDPSLQVRIVEMVGSFMKNAVAILEPTLKKVK